MAKVRGPLMSLRASGTLGSTLTYQQRASGSVVYSRTVPYDTKHPFQMAIRGYVTQAVEYWQKMSPEYKTKWNVFVK